LPKEKPIEMTEKRDYLFDNIKGAVIFLVVWEHFLGETIRSGSVAGDVLCTSILMFHMSVMMFVSGYFSKNLEKNTPENSIRRILIPYLLISLLTAVIGKIATGEFVLEIFKPTFAMWYIVVLFFYRLCLSYLVKVRGVLFWSFLLAMVSGMFPEIASYPTMGRFLTNLPFFLMGYYCSEAFVNKLRGWMRRPEQCILLAAFLILTLGTTGLYVENAWSSNIYRNNTTYAAAKMSDLQGMGCRVLFYLIGIFAILCFLTCFSRRKSFLCKAGKNSLVVYFFHIYFYEIVCRLEFLKGGALWQFLLVTVFAVFTVWVLSMDLWSRIFHQIIQWTGDLIFGRNAPQKKGLAARGEREDQAK
jgi:fucose 4-O-acetylase-like acetyltransferase